MSPIRGGEIYWNWRWFSPRLPSLGPQVAKRFYTREEVDKLATVMAPIRQAKSARHDIQVFILSTVRQRIPDLGLPSSYTQSAVRLAVRLLQRCSPPITLRGERKKWHFNRIINLGWNIPPVLSPSVCQLEAGRHHCTTASGLRISS